MNPSDPHERNTVLERSPQFSSNSDHNPHDWFQLAQNGSYSSPLSSPQSGGRKPNPAFGMSYRTRDSHLRYSSLSQGPHDHLWRWYLGHSNKQRLAIGCGVLISLLLIGAVFGAIASAVPTRPQPQATTMQATQTVTDHVPTSTAVAMLIPNPTLIPTSPASLRPTFTPSPMPTPSLRPTFTPSSTPTPSLRPTFTPSPTPTPKPIEKVNVTVTSQIVKKVGIEYRYIFDILNNDSKSFSGSVTISLYNDSQQTPLGQQTFNMTQLLQPGLGSVVYFDIPIGPASLQNTNGVTRFKYAILVNGQQANAGEGQITSQYEDTSLF